MVSETSQINVSVSNMYNPHAEAIIEEVKKRPILWNRNHREHKNRRKIFKEWEAVEENLKHTKLTADELKSKWRNIKDSFFREMKKVQIPPGGTEGKPLIEFYTGQWSHFETLMFLKDSRKPGINFWNDGCGEDDPDRIVYVQNLKEEFDDNDDSNVDLQDNSEDSCLQPEMIMVGDVLGHTQEVNSKNDELELKTAKRNRQDDKATAKKIRLERTREESTNSDENDIDEDLYFVKSLVPFLRKLNPVRKLIVRNEIQGLLLKELLCEDCKSHGPRRNCKCNK